MFIYRGFRKTLQTMYGKTNADKLWKQTKEVNKRLRREYPDINGDAKMMIIPAVALYTVLMKHNEKRALELLKEYGKQTGEKIRRIIYIITSFPGLPKLLWKNMPSLMRKTSSTEAGYTRRIVSETKELVGVDILSCPLHDAAIKMGFPEVTQIVCAMDKAYMSGFKYIDYTRTTSVAEGYECCDYRLRYNKNKR